MNATIHIDVQDTNQTRTYANLEIDGNSGNVKIMLDDPYRTVTISKTNWQKINSLLYTLSPDNDVDGE
jgi:hypothetical protein